MFKALLNALICGKVASPTPTVPISADSISRIVTGNPASFFASAAAVIQPAVPPPTMQMLVISDAHARASANGFSGILSSCGCGSIAFGLVQYREFNFVAGGQGFDASNRCQIAGNVRISGRNGFILKTPLRRK
ncbi:N-acetylglucosamine kinase-like BadF-type ATPase [Sphingomonas sp. PvP055]